MLVKGATGVGTVTSADKHDHIYFWLLGPNSVATVDKSHSFVKCSSYASWMIKVLHVILPSVTINPRVSSCYHHIESKTKFSSKIQSGVLSWDLAGSWTHEIGCWNIKIHTICGGHLSGHTYFKRNGQPLRATCFIIEKLTDTSWMAHVITSHC